MSWRPPPAPCFCGVLAPAIFHTSCRMRAAWSPAQRAAFDDADARGEALELAFPWGALALAAPDPASVFEPRYRKKVPDLVGTTYGRWTVKALEYRPGHRGKAIRCWRVRCGCGTERLIPTCEFARPGLRDALECGACTRRRRSQRAAPRYGGLLVSELARRAGVSLNAVRKRIRRGWPIEQVSAPRRSEPAGRIAA